MPSGLKTPLFVVNNLLINITDHFTAISKPTSNRTYVLNYIEYD